MPGILFHIWRNEEGMQKSDVDAIHKLLTKCWSKKKEYVVAGLPHNWSCSTACYYATERELDRTYSSSDVSTVIWNGRIYSGEFVKKNWPGAVGTLLMANKNVPSTLVSILGPYCLIYYDKEKSKLWFAKDHIGRRSLIMKLSSNHDHLILSSVMSKEIKDATEVPAIGIFVFDLEHFTLSVHPWVLPDTNFEQKVKDLNTVLGIELIVLKTVFQRRREFSNLQPDPEPRDITHYDEILFSVTANEHSNKSEPQISDIKEHSGNVDTKFENEEVVGPTTNSLKIISCANKSLEISNSENEFEISDHETITLQSLALADESNIRDNKKIDHVMNKLSIKPEIRQIVQRVLSLLKNSMRVRLTDNSWRCDYCERENRVCYHFNVGILFSGGLDSTILAALTNNFDCKGIDLINVAFENPARIDPSCPEKNSTYWCTNFDSPDRKSSRQALAELQQVYPNRKWNLVECNIRKIQTDTYHQNDIDDLIYPNTAIPDSSVGCALWYASKGSGKLSSNGQPYTSPCNALLLGIGADELFGGYARHRTTLQTDGWSGLTKELNAELANVSNMNLAVADRVVSNHNRQPLFPYLDEELIQYVRSLNAWERCFPTEDMPEGLGDKLLLRLVAYELGLHKTANVPQRSIVIGSGLADILEEPS